MKNLKLLIMSAFLLLAGLTFMPQSVTGNVEEDCHENGHCEIVCGPEGTVACSYADCGSGTQLCYSRN